MPHQEHKSPGLDITERKQAEVQIKTSEQRFYNSLSSMYGSILVVSNEGKVEFANQAFCDLFGYKESPEDLIGFASNDIIQKVKKSYLNSDRGEERIKEVVARGQPVKGEEVALTGGRTCLRDYIPIFVDGKPCGRLWHHIDITERKKADEALLESEEKYRRLVKYAPAAIYEMDLQGTKFLSVNDVMCDIIGYSREELLSMKPAELMSAESSAIFGERIKKKLAGEKIDETTEYSVRRKDGGWINIDVRVGAFNFSNEKFSSVVVIGHDITERKRAEEEIRRRVEELRRANEELERFNRAMVERELRMIELKKQVNELSAELGKPAQYNLRYGEEEK